MTLLNYLMRRETDLSAVAVQDKYGALSYGQLWDEVGVLAAALGRKGLGPGQGVALSLANSRYFVIAALAAVRCGAVVVPFWPSLPGRADLIGAGYCMILGDERLDGVSIGGPSSPLRCVVLMENRRRILIPWMEGPAFVRYTSGTTGRAKGVVLSEQAVVERIGATARNLQVTGRDVVAWTFPMAHHFYATVLTWLSVGATIVIGGDDDHVGLVEMGERHGATLVFLSPVHLRAIVQQGLAPRLAGAGRILSSTFRLDPIWNKAIHAATGKWVSQCYGIIEIGIPLVNLADPGGRMDAVGLPGEGYEVAIRDDGDEGLGSGAIGELLIRGPGMFSGYMESGGPIQGHLDGGWFRTGDMASRDEAGFVVIHGRRKSMIRRNGRLFFPEAAQGRIEALPGVARARVLVGGDRVRGVQVASEGVAVDREKVVAIIGRFGFPIAVEDVQIVDRIATTATGKIRL